MKNKVILLILLIFVIGVIVVVGLRSFGTDSSTNQTGDYTNSSYESQKDEKGEVVVEAVPLKLSSKENSEFSVTFTTHSIDLNYDIKIIATLSDDKGNRYEPISWTGGKGGHHIEGILTFPKISLEASSVILTIPKIDNQDRTFEWSL